MQIEDEGTYYCYKSGDSIVEKTVGGQLVSVDYPLQSVDDIECVWHNWKVKLVCTLNLPPYRHMKSIDVNIVMYNGAYIECPDMVNKKECTWYNNIDTAMLYFRVNVTNTNKQKKQTITGKFITKLRSENVKPSAVESFQQHYTDKSTCLLLTWTYDKNIAKSRLKYYRIQYFPVADPSQNKTVETDEDNATVCQLTPYTEYKFTITVHPGRVTEVKGYRSDPVTIHIRTDQDIPRTAPEIVAYRQSVELCAQKRETPAETVTTVFWKSLPEVDRNGVITNYMVSYAHFSPGGIATEVIVKNTENNSVNLRLLCDKLYNVSISAATNKGYSPHHSSLIINTTGTSLPVVMVERNNSLYNVSWTVPWHVDSLISFSVVYCKQLGSQQSCIGDLEKVDVPGSYTRSQTLSLTSNTTYLFGVSVIRDGLTNAAMFESCVYVVTETPTTPEFTVEDSIGDNSLRVDWDPSTCNNKQPYVISFTITWCPTKYKQEDQCSGQEQMKVIPSTAKTEYIISNLEKDVRYGVRMLSSSSSQSSRLSGMKYGTPTNNDISKGIIVVIVISSLFVVIFIIAGFSCLCRLLKQKYKQATKPFEFDTPDLPIRAEDSDSDPPTDSNEALLRPKHEKNKPIFDCHPALLETTCTYQLDFKGLDGRTNPVMGRAPIENQISIDSGTGESLSTEPESPSRLSPVPENNPSPFTKKVPGTSSDSTEPDSTHSSGNENYSTIIQSTSHRSTTSERSDPGRVHIDHNHQIVGFAGEFHPRPVYVTEGLHAVGVISPTEVHPNKNVTMSQEHSENNSSGTPDYCKVDTAKIPVSTRGNQAQSKMLNNVHVNLNQLSPNSLNALSIHVSAPYVQSTLSYVGSTTVTSQSTTPYVDSTTVTSQSTTPYVDSTTVTSQSTTPYVDPPTVTCQSTTPYVDSTTVTSQSTTPYVDSTTVTKQSTTPYVDSTTVTSQSTNPYVDPPTVTKQSTTPYVDSTTVTCQSTTPYVDSTTVTSQSTTPYVDSTTVTCQSTTPYVDSTTVTSQSTTPYVDSTTVTKQSTTPYVDSTTVINKSTTPYVDSTTVPNQSTTPYVDSTTVTCQSTTPYVDSTTVTSQSTTPYVDSTTVTCQSTNPYVGSTTVPNQSTTPYVDSTTVTCQSTNPYVGSTTVPNQSTTPYVDSTTVTKQSTTPYVDSTTVTSQSTTPYVDSTTVTRSQCQSTTPYVGPTTVTSQSTTPYVDSTTVTNQSTTPYVDPPTVTSQSTTPYVDSTTVTSQSTTPYVDPTTVTSQSTTPYVDSTTVINKSTTPYVDSTTVTSQSTTPYVDPTTVTSQSTTPYVDSTTVTSQSTNPYVDSTTVTNQSSPSSVVDSTDVTQPSPTPYVGSTDLSHSSQTPSSFVEIPGFCPKLG
ncbi:LOW QUALITY PROTEIN: mucin-2-like [Ylistrum balloti]|uniref:LOW QUALITY PROTEIN: mucin-2-like n=1 Tax=Ylistrum balloti TaxID=509963 RepID=UPI00290599EE|nr:LOW QUALITY PROTEIN: mucin-2-like [Ylistrum balloti]